MRQRASVDGRARDVSNRSARYSAIVGKPVLRANTADFLRMQTQVLINALTAEVGTSRHFSGKIDLGT